MEAVDRLRETERRLSDLEALTREQGSALWGDNVRRDNGVRSKVQAHDAAISSLQEQMLTIKSEWRHYIDVGRKESCEGLKALAQFEAKADDDEEEETEVTVAKINMKAYVLAAMIPSTITAILMAVQMLFKVGSTQ